MEQDFPYLKIKPRFRKLLGAVDEDTRIFRQAGFMTDFQAWMQHLHEEVNGDLIPATWVPEYVGVSRAAVHKRIKAGRLTMFVFELHDPFPGPIAKLTGRPKVEYAYCVRSECFAWYEEITFRNARKGPPELFN